MADFKSKLQVDLIAKTNQFNQAIGKAEGKIKSFSSNLTKTGKMMTTRLSLPLAALGTLAVKQAANFEKLQTTLNTLTGSAEEGAAAFEKLVQFSAKTPFQLNELVKVNNTLMGFGLSTNQAFNSLSMLGDIAGIVGGDLQSIGVAFGQAAAEGRVMTRDLRQFINNGVPILDILATSMGVARGEIMDMASEGKISFDILNKAFKDATSEGGKFHNGMEVLSQTLNGLFSTLKDNVNIALATLGDEIAKTLNLKEGIPALSKRIKELVDGFKSLDKDTQKLIITVGLLATVLPPLLILIGTLISSITTITAFISALNPIVVALTVAIGGLAAIFIRANTHGISFGKTLKNMILSAGNINRFALLQAAAENTATALERMNQSVAPSRSSIIEKGLAPGGTTTGGTTSTSGGFEDPAMGGGFLGINPFIMGTGFMTLSGIIDKELPKMSNHINGFTMYMDNLTKKITDFKVSASDDFSQVAEVIDDKINVLTPFLQGFANSLTNAFSGASTSFESFAMSMLVIVGDLLIQMGMAAMAASKLSELFAIPGVGFAAGLAAFVLGAMIKGIASSVQEKGFKKMASGGIVSGPTTALIGEYPGARSNPEVVAPLSKLKSMIGGGGAMQGEFVLRGQDLVVALQRAERNRNRFK
ncbi:MAG: putative tape measure protein [Prokaryotic dsDNA virus sp.]|nr:MAG: putative tape measure protein [Prokaryotic dsDNA virus sp.]|tara:strand:+ start:297 stop:2237 length:1941 start_codon:yes stop_codon:yes gene_type:complete